MSTTTGAVREQSPIIRWWRTLPAVTRRQATIGSVIFAYVFIIGVGVLWNVSVFTERSELERTIAAHEAELALAPIIHSDTIAQGERQAELQAAGAALYRDVPDGAGVPVIVGRLETLAVAVGGELTEIHYREPVWVDDAGQVGVGITFRGDFQAVEDYVASVTASVPTLQWRTLHIEPQNEAGDELLLGADLTLDVLAARPVAAPRWNEDRMQLVAVAAKRNPFAVIGAGGVPMPDLVLTGVVRRDGGGLALVLVDGESHVLRVGDTVGALEVVEITASSVFLRHGERVAEITLAD